MASWSKSFRIPNETRQMNRHFINRSTLIPDLSAGLVLGVQSIPSGMANGLLAMVNPVYGLHGYMVGVLTGAFFTSSAFMSVQGTSAMALVIASVPEVAQGGYPNTALFALAFLTGVFMLAAGLLKLGSLIRFVPHSVMTGFINAVAVLIILMLAGVDPDVVAQIERTGIVQDIGRENLFQATQDIGQALMQAVAAAESWIGEKQEENLSANDRP
jgi:MFS superfamily sulfate permease-like transporter